MIKTRKIEIIPTGDKKYITETIKRYSQESCEMANEVVRTTIFNIQRYNDFKKENPNILPKDMGKEYAKKYGFTARGFAYDVTKSYDMIASVRAGLSDQIQKTLSTNQKDIFSNKVSIPSFTKDKMPVYFMWRTSKVYVKENKYYFQISNDLTFIIHFGRDRSNNKSIVDKILSGEYKGCDSCLTVEKGKIFLNLTFKFEPEQVMVPYSDIVLGIDLGINRPLTIARSDGKYIEQIELGEFVSTTRMQFQKRRKNLSKSLKYSRDVIKKSQLNNIGKIRMEDLTGITKDSTDYFFKSWPYYQLQQMIEYKAKEFGIEIEYVVAKDTSKTCHCCGVVQEDARDKKDVSKFVCQTVDCNMFGVVQDADINAAINISKKQGAKEKPKSKKGKIESWKKKQESLQEDLTM